MAADLTEGVHIATPGALSRWGVIDVGLKCMHSCEFCYYSWLGNEPGQFAGMRKAPFAPREHLLDMTRGLKANGFIGFDVTGGEPCLHPDIVALVAEASRLGLASRVITLGQYLMRPMKSVPEHKTLLGGLLSAGLTDLLLSVHAVDEDSFREITGESWAKLREAMDRLDVGGFDYGTNTTVFAGNFRLLPQIAAQLVQHRVYVANLIVMNAYYAWSRPGSRRGEVQGHYGEIRPYLLEARDRLEDAGIAVNIRYAPLCTVKGMERNLVGIVGVRHDPHEWMNMIEHAAPGPAAAMARRLPLSPLLPQYRLQPDSEHVASRAGKAFPEKCRRCHAIAVCDGVDRRYLAERGDAELEPYTQFRGELLDWDRLAYLPAHVVKLAPFAPVKETVASMFRGEYVAAA